VGTEKQKALLGPRDILLTPEFGNMGIADFALMPEGIKIGEAVANSAAARLDALSRSLRRLSQRQAEPARRAQRPARLLHRQGGDHQQVAPLRRHGAGHAERASGQVQTYESLEAGSVASTP
jgi:NTE family protein